MKRFLLILVTLLFISTFLSATENNNFWQDITESSLKNTSDRGAVPNKYRTLSLNESSMKGLLNGAPLVGSTQKPLELSLPMPDGTMQAFLIKEYKIAEPGFYHAFPSISTYSGWAKSDQSMTVKLDFTYQGFHAIIYSKAGSVYIDPYFKVNDGHYLSYNKKDYPATSFSCGVHDSNGHSGLETISSKGGPNPVGSQIRSYRIAIAGTGEYSTFHGGTVALVQSAIVTAVNRINSVFERELAITFVIVANNSAVTYLNAGSDPYQASNDGFNMNINQTVMDTNIGTGNYDIGHVFHTMGGGLASLQCVCSTGNKAKGFSALPNPINDPFVVDYVSHEMGHQFGATHTFNTVDGGCSGNRTANTAYEPGSGVTIMAYAGLCPPSNFSNSSIDQFHTASFDQIANFVSGNGGVCATKTNSGNNPPVVDAGVGGHVIPMLTPFELTGSATDANGDSLSYCWEQYDKGAPYELGQTGGSCPLFRPYPPVASPTRVFPKIQNIIFNNPNNSEILPDYTRNLNFRLTVRDNNASAGGVDWDQMSMTVSDAAGPFKVLSQFNSGNTYYPGQWVNVEWDVANTDQSPVNCGSVDVHFSDNAGVDWPTTLVTNITNDGDQYILMPNSLGNGKRLKVKCSNNVFFNVTNSFFEISAPSSTGYEFVVANSNRTICGGTNAEFDIFVSSKNGYSDVVNFTVSGAPAGTNATFSSTSVTPAGTTKLTITNTGGLATGVYNLTVDATSTAGTQAQPITLEVFANPPTAPALVAPADMATNEIAAPLFTWNSLPDATSYDFELALNANFTTIVYAETGITTLPFQLPNGLAANTIYFWRVRGVNVVCGDGAWSAPYSFTTEVLQCSQFMSVDVPLSPPYNAGTYPTELVVPDNRSIRDINVIGLAGTHPDLGEVTFTLESPAGTNVDLVDQECAGTANYNLTFDSESPTTLPCPYNGGMNYMPTAGSLQDFNTEMSMGTWLLKLTDSKNFNYGTLTAWGLEICYPLQTKTEVQPRNLSGIHLFPNPAENQLNIELTAHQSEPLTVRVVNAAGQLLLSEKQVTLQAGLQQIQLNTSSLANGVYFVHFKGLETGFAGTEKFTILR